MTQNNILEINSRVAEINGGIFEAMRNNIPVFLYKLTFIPPLDTSHKDFVYHISLENRPL